MMGISDEQARARRREALIAKISPYCTPNSRMHRMMMIAADGVSYKEAVRRVPGLDWDTYEYLMRLHRGGKGPDGNISSSPRQAVYELIREGATFEEIQTLAGIDRYSAHNYATEYAKAHGIKRSELHCIKAAREAREERVYHARVTLIKARKAMGYTRADMAEQLGISYGFYGDVENGRANFSGVVWEALEQMLKVSRGALQERSEVRIRRGDHVCDYV